MKTKAIIFCLLLTIGYYFFTIYLVKRKSPLSANQSQWSDNIIKTQRFLYEYDKKHYSCILGSSVSSSIVSDKLSKNNIYNLSLIGHGVLDGLQVVKHKQILPETLFVEMNFVSRSANIDFLDKVVGNDYVVRLKEFIPLFREKYVPIGLFSNCFADIYERSRMNFYYNYIVQIIKNKIIVKRESHVPVLAKNDWFDKLIIQQKRSYTDIGFEQKNNIDLVVSILKDLEISGVKIFFYEVPMHCDFEQASVILFNKASLRTAFATQNDKFIKSLDCKNFITSDGIHLDSKGNYEFTNYFIEQLKME
jgi:hypothetical protein